MGWYEALKDVLTVADKLRDAELKQKLAQVQVECAKLAEDNAHLRQENIALKEQAQTRNEMQHKDNVYWRVAADGKVEGPYCPKCLDGEHKTSRMAERSEDSFWRCPVCNCCMKRPGNVQRQRQTRADTRYDPFSS